MNDTNLRRMLLEFKAGAIDQDAVIEYVESGLYEDVGFAKIDHHRAKRKGFPEVIYCAGKSKQQVVEIFQRLADRSDKVLATRADSAVGEAVCEAVKDAKYHEIGQLITLGWSRSEPEVEQPYIAVISAGTSDLSVAEEAAVTAEIMGSKVVRVYDVGVAGLHRLFGELHKIEDAKAAVVVAGMEGALASVIGGLIHSPIIAVPTSVGYGAALGGMAALLGMLNSCAPGVTVVNIDNGFGAGYSAHLISTV
ncbi:MAG: nickel pincer cofactor biosynthesis protein LarB [Firmicutes bacterium]|nr:nickel pincer cofactor biosynthesis protein LarB [Bacillota bacterium]